MRYQLRVLGRLDAHWSAWLDNLTLATQDDGTTTLTGMVQDQSQLHGLLDKIRDLGVILIRVELMDDYVADEDSNGWTEKGTPQLVLRWAPVGNDVITRIARRLR